MPDVKTLLIVCSCGQRMKVPADAVGKTTACVKCGERLRIGKVADKKKPKATDSGARDPKVSNHVSGTDVVIMLEQAGLVTHAQVQEAELVARDLPAPIWEVLVDIGHISAERFHSYVTKQAGATAINLENYSIPMDVIEFVPEDVVRRERVLPVDKLGRLLTIATACPFNEAVVVEVQERTGLKVKAMSCRLDQLRKATAEYYPSNFRNEAHADPATKELYKEIDPILESSEVARRIFELKSIPLLHHTLRRLESLEGTDDLEAYIDILASDPTAAAPVMAAANTGIYGLGLRVDGLGLAACLVGEEGINATLRSLETRDYFDGEDGATMKQLWRRAQFCSEVCRNIASAMGSQLGEIAFVAGLLSELGRVALSLVLPHSYAELTRDMGGAALAELEERLYHLTHMEAAYVLMRCWNLPVSVSEPIRYCRAPATAPRSREVANIVGLGLLITDAHESGDSEILEESTKLIRSLKLNMSQVNDLLRSTGASVSAQ